jgi:hypothetical protein
VKIGTRIKITPPVIEGVVERAVWDEVGGKLQVLVNSTDGEQRWFYTDQPNLEVVEVPQ